MNKKYNLSSNHKILSEVSALASCVVVFISKRNLTRRTYKGLKDLDYPFHDKTVTVTTCGRICMDKRKINLSTVFAGQKFGIKQVEEKIWLVSFMHYDLGYFDHEIARLEPLSNPFGAKVLPMSQVETVTHVSGMDLRTIGAPRRRNFEPHFQYII